MDQASGSVSIPSPRRTYGLVITAVLVLLVGSLLVPLVFGDPVESVVASHTDTDLDLSPVTQPLGAGAGPDAAATSTTLLGALAPGATTVTTRLAAAGPLTASDVGVTPTSIRIGVVLLDLAAVGPLGLGLDNFEVETQKKIFQAYFDDLNKRGGLYGRRAEPVFVVNDPLDATDASKARAQCLKLTKDLKVFTVIGFTTDSAACVAVEQRTPVITYRAELNESYISSQHYMISTPPSAERIATDWADALADLKLLAGKTAGILAGDAAFVRKPADALNARLRSNGIKVGYQANISTNADAAGSQLPLEVQKMRNAGVDSVLFTSDFATSITFMQTAEGQGWRPRYFTSELGALAANGLVRSAPASFDGAIGITHAAGGDSAPGVHVPTRPQDASCYKTYNDTTDGKDFSDDDESPVLIACSLMRVLEPGIIGAGPNLTRAGLVAAVQRIGAVKLPVYIDGQFAPGRTDYASTVRPLRWQYGCKCYINAGGDVPPRP